MLQDEYLRSLQTYLPWPVVLAHSYIQPHYQFHGLLEIEHTHRHYFTTSENLQV